MFYNFLSNKKFRANRTLYSAIRWALFYPVGLQLIPVQFHPVPRPVGRDGFPPFDLKRMGEVLFQAKAVAFQIRGIRYRSERVDMEVMDSMGSYGEVVSLGHPGNLHPDANSTAVGDIRLWEGNRARGDEILKFVSRMV